MKDTPLAFEGPGHRKLHTGHFAFMRAYVQGLDLREIWDRYLAVEGNRTDLRIIRRTVTWLRDAFASAAHRHSRHALARLVRIQVEGSGSTRGERAAAPSLEDFTIARGLEDFGIEDQLAAYQEEHGAATRKEKRLDRLLRRQLEAITWLEGVTAETPHADDGVRAWFHYDIASRLEAAGMASLRLLVERINGVGRNWHAPVRAIGAGKADRIVMFLRTHQASTGLQIGPHATEARATLSQDALQVVVPAATAVVPLEKFIVPSSLDGSAGRYRAPREQCMLNARNDYEALLSFLREKDGRRTSASTRYDVPVSTWIRSLGPTARAYRIECERFMLWALLERNKPLSSIDFDDAVVYRSFISNPQPAARWCAPRGRSRWGPAWRPFEGPLQAAAQRRALIMLGTFYRFLNDQRYVIGNPFASVGKPRALSKGADLSRSFTQDEWGFICARLSELPPTSANLRLTFALPLLYYGRLRRAEIVQARVGDLRWTEIPAGRDEPAEAGWELSIVGKGDKQRFVPLGQAQIEALRAYLDSRGLERRLDDPDNAGVYLLGQAVDLQHRAPWAARKAINPREGISAQTLYAQLKTFFADCAARTEEWAPHSSERFKRASTHWMRHTGISHSLAAGTPVDVEMNIVGHASMATTSRYTHSEARRRLSESRAFLSRQALASQAHTVEDDAENAPVAGERRAA
jgi:site-specific recombinase XerD